MRMIGFSFNKLQAERNKSSMKDLKISADMDISNVRQIKTDLFKGNEEILEVEFTYTVKYSPDIANINLRGVIVLSADQKKAKEVLKDWKKKKIDPEFKIILYNIVLKKSSLKALELEDQLNLPYHIPMPAIRRGQKQSK